jgi:hypothetical protein
MKQILIEQTQFDVGFTAHDFGITYGNFRPKGSVYVQEFATDGWMYEHEGNVFEAVRFTDVLATVKTKLRNEFGAGIEYNHCACYW